MSKFKLGDTTPKGTVTCVMFSRHTLGSRYLVDGHEYAEWELLGQPKPELNHTDAGTYGLKPIADAYEAQEAEENRVLQQVMASRGEYDSEVWEAAARSETAAFDPSTLAAETFTMYGGAQ